MCVDAAAADAQIESLPGYECSGEGKTRSVRTVCH